MSFALKIINPQTVLFERDADSINLPGERESGHFTILTNHAPFMSTLGQGKILVSAKGTLEEFQIKDGFLEVANNIVNVLVTED